MLLAAPAQAAPAWNRILDQPAEWYESAEALEVAGSVLLYQTESGGWPKNTDMTRPPPPGDFADPERSGTAPTIDNGATTTQIRFLARVAAARPVPPVRSACQRGFDYLLRAQYANGGWPQFYPLRGGYHARITYNDGAMTDVLRLLDEVARGAEPFEWVGEVIRARARDAVTRGIDCILRTQVVVEGRRTAWCAQHDEVTLAPAAGRAFEPISLSGAESVDILEFLISLPRPSPAIVAAVKGGVHWLESVQLRGWRLERMRMTERGPEPDQYLVPDAGAGPLWARFYEIGTNRPIFAGRDGRVHGDLAKVEKERRTGYGYYGTWGRALLREVYPRWCQELAAQGLSPAAGSSRAQRP